MDSGKGQSRFGTEKVPVTRPPGAAVVAPPVAPLDPRWAEALATAVAGVPSFPADDPEGVAAAE